MIIKYYKNIKYFATVLTEGIYREYRWDDDHWTELDTMPILRWRDEFDPNLQELAARPSGVNSPMLQV